MPQSEKSHTQGRNSIEGRVIRPQNERELIEAINLAFDYRGDVTLIFKDGSRVEGFLYQFDEKAWQVHLFVKNGRISDPAVFEARQIVEVAFSGEDTAFGKSWDEWTAKSQAQRQREAQLHQQKAVELGHL